MDTRKFISSGIIECYCLGTATAEEAVSVALLARKYPEIRTEIEEIQNAIEEYVTANSVTPPASVKQQLLLKIQRDLPSSEQAISTYTVPAITWMTGITDDVTWNRINAIPPPAEYDEMYLHPLHADESARTAVAWVKSKIEEEMHTNEMERFLILEGSCDCIVDGIVHKMVPGDFMEIYPGQVHTVMITSAVPVKALFQRSAA